MTAQESIEVLIANEFRSLCLNCAHFKSCSYRRNATKTIIQCEMYELSLEKPYTSGPLAGLCMNCVSADTCGLPQRQSGAWHCEEYT